MAKGGSAIRKLVPITKMAMFSVKNLLDADEIGLLGRAAREDRVLDQHPMDARMAKAAQCASRCGTIPLTQSMGRSRAANPS